MTRRTVRQAASVIALACGIFLASVAHTGGADDNNTARLPDKQFNELVKRATQAVDEGLRDWKDPKVKEKERKEHYRKARAAAVLLAVYAQQSQTQANAVERATLRDAALKLATSIKDNRVADGRKQLDGIKAGLKPNPNADLKPVQFMPRHVEIEEVMKPFSSFQNLMLPKGIQKKRALPNNVVNDEWILMLYQTAMIAEVSKEHVPPRRPGGGPAQWKQFNNDMRKEVQELIKLTGAPNFDSKAAFKALERLDGACSNCHRIFR
jgi:hypothetical protein